MHLEYRQPAPFAVSPTVYRKSNDEPKVLDYAKMQMRKMSAGFNVRVCASAGSESQPSRQLPESVLGDVMDKIEMTDESFN